MADAARKAPDLALLLAAKPKGDDDAPDSERGGSTEEYRSYAETAFPDSGEWTDERIAALKSFVMACMG